MSTSLRTGNTRSCGCLIREFAANLGRGHTRTTKSVDMTGRRFSNVTAETRTKLRAPGGSVIWTCRCDCGKNFNASAGHLTAGSIVSCGCKKGDANVTHGATRNADWTPEYAAWASMLGRCTNPRNDAFDRYGGRGIAVCDRWRDFSSFLADMGERPTGTSLDRWPDNNGNYKPENCRWATPTEQARNMRSNRMLVARGETRCLAEWADISGLRPQRIAKRISAGWTVERAIFTPVRHR